MMSIVRELELAKTWFHSQKGMLVVRMMGRRSWRHPTTVISTFSADVFGEE